MRKEYKHIKILVACHKPDANIRQDDIYIPIQVGKALHPEINLGFQCDNTGDNISEKNDTYCELTAIYWAWKNLPKDVDIVGLCHYRRYFDFTSHKGSFKVLPQDELLNTNLSPHILETDKEVVLPKFWTLPHNVWRDFSSHVLQQDLYILYKVIESYYPEYLSSFEKYILGNKRTAFNMFLMNRDVFDDYCGWLFGILSKVEQLCSLHSYTSYRRLYGYLGEILLPVYCLYKKLKITQHQIILGGKNKSNIYSEIKYFIKKILNNCSFFLGNIPHQKKLHNDYWETYLKIDNIKVD